MFSKKKPPLRVMINGCGRIGRLVFRYAWEREDMEVAHINEPEGNAPVIAHLLQFDSIYGPWNREVSSDGESITVEGKSIGFSQADQPAEIPFPEEGIDIVFECSGKFRRESVLEPFLYAGASKVVVAAPMKEGGQNIIMGLNDGPNELAHGVLSATSGAANCLALAVKVINDTFGLARGSFTALHNVTNSQNVVDQVHKDPRRARAAGESLIPTTTRASTVVPQLIPEMKDRLSGNAIRVPLQSASLMDCSFELSKQTSVEEVNNAFRIAADGELAGLLRVEDRPLVSVDYRGESASAVLDALSTAIVDNTHLNLYLWYDNEAAFAHRMVDLAIKSKEA